MMKRLHAFELMDQNWWPACFKAWETDYLSVGNRLLGLYRAPVSRLGKILSRLGITRLVDLCSGSGQHLAPILDQIEKERNTLVSITLTDIEPRLQAYAEAQRNNARIGFSKEKVDACSVPPTLKGFRTMFAGFHHFCPEQANGILKDAYVAREGIAIFEHTQRNAFGIFSMLFTPVLVWALTPFIRPFSLARLFWTYLIPVIPLAILWDGIISACRTYTPGEIKGMISNLQSPDYQWHVENHCAGGVINTTLVLGYPSSSRIEQEAISEHIPQVLTDSRLHAQHYIVDLTGI